MIEDATLRARDGVDDVREGFWLIQRRRARRVDIPVRIWFGPPADPDQPGEVLDRSWRWQIELGGFAFEEPMRLGGILFAALTDFWPTCCTDPIDEAEYRFRVEMQEWAAAYDPNDARGTPGGRIDPMTCTLPFLEP